MSKNLKNWQKLMKIANIDREFLPIFWRTWGNSIKFSEKMCFEIILKVTKTRDFTLPLEDTFFQKTTRGAGGGGGLIWPAPPRHIRVKFSTTLVFPDYDPTMIKVPQGWSKIWRLICVMIFFDWPIIIFYHHLKFVTIF